MKVLLDGGARWEGSAALQLAAKAGKVKRVKLLVGCGADVNEIVTRVEEKSVLRLADERGCEEVVRMLKKQGAKEEVPHLGLKRSNLYDTLPGDHPKYVYTHAS